MTEKLAALDRLALLSPLTPEEKATRAQLASAAASATAMKAEMAFALPVTASTLFSDYTANEVSADTKYKGKKLLVTGTADGVEKHGLTGSAVFVQLRTSNQFTPVQAQVTDADVPRAGTLSKGDPVKLLCTAQGMVLNFVQLDDCRFAP